VKLATSEQMRTLDRATIEGYGIPGVVLMENAGRAVAEAAAQTAAAMASDGHILVLCGRGNNGGDGFVAARHLHNKGLSVEICLLTEADKLSGEAAANYNIARQMGLTIREMPEAQGLDDCLVAADLVIDAILGTGISGEVRGAARTGIEAVNKANLPVIAVDIPSGVSADTGAILGEAVEAQRTLTFGLAKVGHYCYPGCRYCGEIEIVDISLPADLVAAQQIPTNLATAAEASAMLPARWADMHKGDAGRLLIVAGSVGMTGAAALAGLGAARSGAGLVTLAIPASLNDIIEAKCTEVMTLPLPETDQHSLAPPAEEEIQQFADGCAAVALGPGISQVPATAQLARALIAQLPQPLVIDADGLNACAADPQILTQRSGPTIITPHPGELSRLTHKPISAIQQDRVGAARQAADDLHCIVVLKGAGTVIATPDGEAWINSTGNSGMASGGVGDVLTGVISALLAGGASPLAAAVSGTYYHGLASDWAAEHSGERGLVASDLLEQLPAAFTAT